MVFWRSAWLRKSLMVRTVFILFWDYKYRWGLSDDICLFSAPLPTSTFMRVVLCIHGMACHDMTWPRPSIRWKRGGYSSHLMCRQRGNRNRAAMRAAYLVLMALSEGKSLMVRTVSILLWDYNYRRGLSDDICLFGAPIPTSAFMRVVLCIHGMACHDMTWPRPSIRRKRGACSSHLMCVKEQLVIE